MEKVPRLVNPENFKNIIEKISKPVKTESFAEIKLENIKPVKWNLNKILLILFALFTVFFLYNCKYGMFKCVSNEPMPYSLVYNNSI